MKILKRINLRKFDSQQMAAIREIIISGKERERERSAQKVLQDFT